MPVTHVPTLLPDYCPPLFERTQYMLASDVELHSPIFIKNFSRLFEEESFQLHEALNSPSVESIQKYGGRDILLKQELKQFHKSQYISYDQYRMKNVSLDDLYTQYRFLDKCQIYIHESDFIDFDLKILSDLSVCHRAGFPLAIDRYIQQYRITRVEVETFETFMKKLFLPQVDISDPGRVIDARLDLSDILRTS